MWSEHYFPREKNPNQNHILKTTIAKAFFVYIIVNSLIHAKDCHIQVSALPNTQVEVEFAIKLKIPHWRIVTIEIDTMYEVLFPISK